MGKIKNSDLVNRFWLKVDIRGQDECWPWLGAKIKKDGRGVFWDGHRNVVASRFALECKLSRSIASGMFACHSCDNPNCVNPLHLWEGTAKENTLDARQKKRLNGMLFSHCPRGHKYDEHNTFSYRGQRCCRTCRNASRRAIRSNITIEEALNRPARLVTHCPQGHEYTEDNTVVTSSNGYKSRHCRECKKVHQKNYNSRQKARAMAQAIERGEHMEANNATGE